jgi:hypothetical protein
MRQNDPGAKTMSKYGPKGSNGIDKKAQEEIRAALKAPQ